MTCEEYLSYLEVCGKLPFTKEDLKSEYSRVMSGNIDIRETIKIINIINKDDNSYWDIMYYLFEDNDDRTVKMLLNEFCRLFNTVNKYLNQKDMDKMAYDLSWELILNSGEDKLDIIKRYKKYYFCENIKLYSRGGSIQNYKVIHAGSKDKVSMTLIRDGYEIRDVGLILLDMKHFKMYLTTDYSKREINNIIANNYYDLALLPKPDRW